ncbi:MAG: hypothetical protein JNN03_03340 [Rubrivivax sp.]|nr:hypothetical protein [Rubrivivax sp.]
MQARHAFPLWTKEVRGLAATPGPAALALRPFALTTLATLGGLAPPA